MSIDIDITHATDPEVVQLEKEISDLRSAVFDHDTAVRLALKKQMLRHERDRLAGLLRDAGIEVGHVHSLCSAKLELDR